MTLKISTDGGITFQDAPSGVRIIFTDVTFNDEGKEEASGDGAVDAELHLTVTHEGLIQDVYAVNDSNYGANSVGTSSATAQEIVDRLTS